MDINPENLYRNSHRNVTQVSMNFKRELHNKINWNARIIGIKAMPVGAFEAAPDIRYGGVLLRVLAAPGAVALVERNLTVSVGKRVATGQKWEIRFAKSGGGSAARHYKLPAPILNLIRSKSSTSSWMP